jgi:signal peptidase I
MSDEHKPHDDHGPGVGQGPDVGHGSGVSQGTADQTGHPAGEPAGHDTESHAAAPSSPDNPGHAALATDHGHEDHGATADRPHDEPGHAPAASGGPGHDAHGHEDHAAPAPQATEDHGHAAAPADHGQDGHSAPSPEGQNDPAHAVVTAEHHDDHPAAEAAPVVAAVAAGSAAAAPSKPPVWSDSGDAPFEDVDTTPVHARGSGGRNRKSGGSSNEGFEIVKTIFFALLIALVLRVFLFQPFTIPSASMEPNLYEGDYIVVSKWSYGYSKHSIPFSPPIFSGRIMGQEPKRGDIVVFKLPRDNETDYIKRLIGLPGDRIQMIDNVLFINGTAVRDVEMSRQDVQNLYGTQTVIQLQETLPEGRQIDIQDWGPGNVSDNTPVFEVPAGHYFMIGDNRDNSQDSRYDQSAGVGYVPAENLIGKAEIILFSWSPGASLWNPVSWFSKIRPSRFFTVLD